jgi:hypothetical protein
MSFGFRKSKKIGLFRIGVSKGGLSVSTGIKGLRIGANSKGTYTSASLPGTGLYKTQYLKKTKNEAKAADTTITTGSRQPKKPLSKSAKIILTLIVAIPVLFFFPPLLVLVVPAGLIWYAVRLMKKSKPVEQPSPGKTLQ